MGFKHYVTETEAASTASVSVATLRRFAEAGYFQLETDSDGLRLYPVHELERIFGLAPANGADPKPAGESKDAAAAPDETAAAATIPAAGSTAERAAITDPAPQPLPETPAANEDRLARVVTQNEGRSPALDVLERETSKLRAICEMHEKLLSLKEAQIQALTDERNWLRSRIERLEDQAQREQLLLLSGNQTIKRLITMQENRRSPIRAALQWLGFVLPPQHDAPQPSAIDITDSASRSDKSDAPQAKAA